MNIRLSIAVGLIAQAIVSGCAIGAGDPAREPDESAEQPLAVETAPSKDEGQDIVEQPSDDESDVTSDSGDGADFRTGRVGCNRNCIDNDIACRRFLDPNYCKQRFLACIAYCRSLPKP